MQHLRRLSGRRRARREAGQFVVDGPVLVAEALDSDVVLDEVYAEPDADPDVLARAVGAGVPVTSVAPGVLAKVTSPVTPQSVAALATIPTDAFVPHRGPVLVLAGVSDPGNFGTLVRVAEAAGATAVVSCADAVDAWNPKCVRAAAGSLFRVPVVDAGDADAAVALLRSAGMTLVSADARGTLAYDRADLSGDLAVILGHEAHGIPPALTAASDAVVSIPMHGRVESLNVAMTGAVLAFEAARQRRTQEVAGSSN